MDWSTSSKQGLPALPAGRQAARQGFTILEILITVFIIGTVVTGIFGLFVLDISTNREGERRVVALALANERAEMIRNLPYNQVGTEGGVPAGAIKQQEAIVRNGLTYTVKTDIRYIDDPFDGLITGSPPDTLNTDYKQARVEVSWTAAGGATRTTRLLLQVSPPGVEGGTAGGTLLFQALSAGGQAVAGAIVTLQNSAVNPAVNITTQTDSAGYLVLPGLTAATEQYVLTVTKNDFTTEQTYAATSSFTPDVAHRHLTMLAGQLTEKTFAIDALSAFNVRTQNTTQAAVPNVTYALQGSKTIGTDAAGQPVYLTTRTGTTNASGQVTESALTWDSYNFTVDGVAIGQDIKETSLVLPVTLDPGTTLDLVATLVPHQERSLHVTVVSPVGLPVDNATVRLSGAGYDVTLGTGAVGQVYFPNNPQLPADLIPSNGDYTLEITAPGFQPLISTVTVSGTTRVRIELVPSP